MAADLPKIQIEPFGCVPTTIGELCVFSITWGSQKEFNKTLGKPKTEYSPADFLKKFVRYICFPKTSLTEGKYKPDKPLLTPNEIASLVDDDLEKIAKLYIDNNPYLFKEFKTKENDKGEIVVYDEYGEVENPRKENESYTQYLLRLFIEYDEKLANQIGHIAKTLSSIKPDLKSFTTIKNFSSVLGESIKNTLASGDSLRKTMESIRPAKASISIIEPSFPKVDLLEIERSLEQARLKPFNDIADRLDQLIDASAQAAEFMIKANEIQTRIAGEIKSSGDETTKFSKKNIILTIVVILLSIIVPSYNIWQSNRDANIRSIETRENINLLVGKLNKINSSIVANETSKIQNDSLKVQVEKQEKIIGDMKILIDNQGNKFHKLEKKLIRNVQ